MTLTLDGEGGSCVSSLHAVVPPWNRAYHAMMDTLEALVVAHAVAGVDVETPAYWEGIETVIDTVLKKHGI